MDLERAERAVADFLAALDVDIEAAEMTKTPARVARMYTFLFDGLHKETAPVWGETFAAGAGGLVAVRRIPFYSMCEHHLVPFFGEASIVYLPQGGRIAGFSKFAALVALLSHRPQLQERLTGDIAREIECGLGAEGVLVVLDAQQLCMMMRGARAHGARTTTSASCGIFRTDAASRMQAWTMLGMERGAQDDGESTLSLC